FLPLFSARTAQTAQGIRQDYPVPFRLFGQKVSGKKLLCTAADVIFAKDKARGRIILADIRPLQRSISQISAPLRLYDPLFAPPLRVLFFLL
ncbi:MAG: hypothetical protein II804_07450, partial [Clostridia bacterium]|nr:hypothetical protein [Clostridia bacterium]